MAKKRSNKQHGQTVFAPAHNKCSVWLVPVAVIALIIMKSCAASQETLNLERKAELPINDARRFAEKAI